MESSLVLAVDNSQDFLALGLSDRTGLIEERRLRSQRHPSEIIATEVSSLLSGHGYGIGSLDCVITTVGPGSFTGIRVALSFCKGIRAGSAIPVVGIPTLDALVLPFGFLEGYHLLPLIDAKKGEVFTALYRVSAGRPERLSPFAALKPAAAAALVRPPSLVFGTGLGLCSALLKDRDGVTEIADRFTSVSVELLIGEGIRRWNGSEETDLRPVYGRLSEAEIRFNIALS